MTVISTAGPDEGSCIRYEGRSYVPEATFDRVVGVFQGRLRETVAFARAHGLTDEMYAAWKSSHPEAAE